MRRLARIALTAALAVACGREGGGLPESVEVTCQADGTTSLSTSAVRPQADGVHVRLVNTTGEHVRLDGLDDDLGLPCGKGETIRVRDGKGELIGQAEGTSISRTPPCGARFSIPLPKTRFYEFSLGATDDPGDTNLTLSYDDLRGRNFRLELVSVTYIGSEGNAVSALREAQ